MNLTPLAWRELAEMAEEAGTTQTDVLERLLDDAYQRHLESTRSA